MRNLNPDNITQAVIASFAGATNPRLREIMTNLVQHLHAFAREVRLTEAEWFRGIEFLTGCGHITNDKRQEFILLSDVLGLSMLTVAMNNDKPAGCTEATVFGPFHVAGASRYELGADIANKLPAAKERILDWFHIGMRFQHLLIAVQGLRGASPQMRGSIKRRVIGAKWLLWHGQRDRCLQRLRAIGLAIGWTGANNAIGRLIRYLHTCAKYLINYAQRRAQGQPFTSAGGESVGRPSTAGH